MINISARTDMHEIRAIEKIVDENPTTKTFYFKHTEKTKKFNPGQFIMLWVPRLDEKPFTISYTDNDMFGLTIEKKGEMTKKLFEFPVGTKLGIRGPHGRGYNTSSNKDKKACVVGGGLGISAILPLIKRLDNPLVVLGAQTKDRFIFFKDIESYHLCTDDGTCGTKGFVTEKLKDLIEKENIEIVYACGPEMMMKAVFDICEKNDIECECSLERFMICGVGICGQCMCDNKRTCQEGPVFSSEKLREMKDFGKSAMIKTGEKVSLKEYYAYRTKY